MDRITASGWRLMRVQMVIGEMDWVIGTLSGSHSTRKATSYIRLSHGRWRNGRFDPMVRV